MPHNVINRDKLCDRNNEMLYYAVIRHDPPFGINAHVFDEAVEKLTNLSLAEIGFKHIEKHQDKAGYHYSIIYWHAATAIRPWLKSAQMELPETVRVTDIVIDTGCFWPWLNTVFDARARGVAELPNDLKPASKIAA
jgi:hypothetical protein